jgi:dipeptidyl aminopeptidase/acylaminoacyl peptidase
LVRQLLEQHKRFEFMAYPEEPHHLDFPADVGDYMERMERFLKLVHAASKR